MKMFGLLHQWSYRIALLAMPLALFNCASSPDYLDAKSTPPVTVPGGSGQERLGELYRVPQGVELQEKEVDVPLPPTIAVQANANIASVQSLDNDIWVVNAKSPATTWSQLVNFWSASGIPLASQNLENASMETVWFDEGTQPGYLTRYRLRLESGFQSNTTEIHLINDRRPEAEAKADALWPNTSVDSVHAQLTANQLVSVLNDKKTSAGDSYLASTIDLPEKMQNVRLDDEPVLSTIVGTERLYQSLTKVLSDRGFQIYEQAPSLGVFHIDQYQVKDKKSSWLRFLSFTPSNKDNGKDRGPLTLDKILMHLPDDPSVNALFNDVLPPRNQRKLSNVPGYLLVLRQQGGRQLIYIRDGYGKLLKPEKAETILNTIRQRLI